MKPGDEVLLLHAAIDGELDAAGMLEVESRLAENAALAREYAALRGLRSLVGREIGKPVAPPALRRRIEAMAASSGAAASQPAPSWRALAASALIAAGLASSSTYLALALRPAGQETGVANASLADVLLAGHKRGLLSGQPVDVASSDRHMVKPWFAARFALAPQVADLGAEGFPLAGGRIDVVDGAPAATLVYRRKEHFISLTELPAHGPAPESPQTVAGYHILAWRDGAVDFWAVSDVDPTELAHFRQALEAALRGG
ncbi:anti-sigma factor family protein [Methylocapsa acidiphila]|uniref:anti-sigma factor family protein n=1 Tax=Methylocapsa acidiphila TaxID=133552 RepID=UPI0004179644|nr:anti-sigma factor [Methylocapsa acidiphila]